MVGAGFPASAVVTICFAAAASKAHAAAHASARPPSPAGISPFASSPDCAKYFARMPSRSIALMIAEGAVSVCGVQLGVGSYGFGLDKPAPGSSEGARFFLYDQAGEKVGDCAAVRDAQIKLPRPLQVVLSKGEPARLYLGRYWVELAAR